MEDETRMGFIDVRIRNVALEVHVLNSCTVETLVFVNVV